MLDGLCKALEQSLHAVLQSDVLGIHLGEVREELRGMRVSDVIAPQPLSCLMSGTPSDLAIDSPLLMAR